MRIANLFQFIVPLTFLAIWAPTSLLNREAQPLPPGPAARRALPVRNRRAASPCRHVLPSAGPSRCRRASRTRVLGEPVGPAPAVGTPRR